MKIKGRKKNTEHAKWQSGNGVRGKNTTQYGGEGRPMISGVNTSDVLFRMDLSRLCLINPTAKRQPRFPLGAAICLNLTSFGGGFAAAKLPGLGGNMWWKKLSVFFWIAHVKWRNVKRVKGWGRKVYIYIKKRAQERAGGGGVMWKHL